jgi:hypothetical protein
VVLVVAVRASICIIISSLFFFSALKKQQKQTLWVVVLVDERTDGWMDGSQKQKERERVMGQKSEQRREPWKGGICLRCRCSMIVGGRRTHVGAARTLQPLFLSRGLLRAAHNNGRRKKQKPWQLVLPHIS